VGSCENGSKNSGFTKCWECHFYMRNASLLKKDSAPWSYLISQQEFGSLLHLHWHSATPYSFQSKRTSLYVRHCCYRRQLQIAELQLCKDQSNHPSYSVVCLQFSSLSVPCFVWRLLLLSPPLAPTLLRSLLKISYYNVNWVTLFNQVSQNTIIPSFSLQALMEFHPPFRHASSEIGFKLYWMESK